MTKSSISSRNRDVADYLAQTSLEDDQRTTITESSSKSAADTARLAQELASEASWADRYVPNTPSETVMTPSVVSEGDRSDELHSASHYMTPDEAPPTYESTVNSDTSNQQRAVPHAARQQERLVDQGQQSRIHGFSPFGRDYRRVETHNSISGDFTLHDSLDLETSSGSINIKLDVRPGPNPAILKLKSQSGSISVTDRQSDLAQGRRQFGRNGSGPFSNTASHSGGPLSWFSALRRSLEVAAPPPPTSDDPRKQPLQHLEQNQELQDDTATENVQYRAIHATIETSSGSINAHLIITPKSDTLLTTNSGSIHLRLTTAGSGPATLYKLQQEDSRLHAATDLSSVLTTSTKSGSQNIGITKGFGDTSSGAIISACRATYGTRGGGSMNIDYPREWTGLVHASTGGGGSVNVRGFGLQYDKRGNGETWAWRGVDEPNIEDAVELRTDGGGSINFSC